MARATREACEGELHPYWWIRDIRKNRLLSEYIDERSVRRGEVPRFDLDKGRSRVESYGASKGTSFGLFFWTQYGWTDQSLRKIG
ncbi:hypothetical protein PsorP6_010868 [Peronosclerospora sorghi]|uniref:Uncharacterized protein n=1 Tax=Peronosclerospora sorghi TaxID=230839 RepID=A0ACC0VXE6_9STRA|nr:hypothetical protein PsorP6_010868 [Peronosclerospora sorghi]